MMSVCNEFQEVFAMKKKDFCRAENISVIIPYADLERLLQLANKLEEFERHIRHLEQRYSAMGLLYSEILERVAELGKML